MISGAAAIFRVAGSPVAPVAGAVAFREIKSCPATFSKVNPEAIFSRSSAGAVPETLRDTLMARLDRHQDARSVAQIAAAIGREFPYELLAMIAPMPAAALHAALSELLQSELIFQHGLPPRATYVFKHAMVQNIAYESQLHRRRRAVHGQIAGTLHKHFFDTPPEVIGRGHLKSIVNWPLTRHRMG